jgi:putative hemolysin
MEPPIHEQLLKFSGKHLPGYMLWCMKWPFVLKILGKLLCLDEILMLRDKLNDRHNFELLHEIIKYAGLTFSVKNIDRVPSGGRLLVVANHPLGGADWILMVQCLKAIRKDIKVVINKDVHTLIVNMRDLFIPVDTYAAFNDLARKQIGECLEREEAVIIYPSGGISILTRKGVRDRRWKNGVARFSREHHTDILPVYIRGRFKLIFYLYPIRLRRFLLVRNLLHPSLKHVELVIGNRISYKDLLEEPDLSVVSSRLRDITYQLGADISDA